MKQGLYTILENKNIAPDTWRMVLEGDTSAITAPGQFLNIKLEGHFLRRPISISDWDETSVTIIYKILGMGTEEMTHLPAGAVLDILMGLGNGFSTDKSGERPLVIGGGVGIPPMFNLTKKLLAEGKKPVVILGFNRKEDMFYTEEFEALGAEVIVATADGNFGVPGFVTDAVKTVSGYTYFFTCGPLPMLEALDKVVETSGQYSFEERMGCGFGACMGCTCKTKYGHKRICKDGPVLEREEVVW